MAWKISATRTSFKTTNFTSVHYNSRTFHQSLAHSNHVKTRYSQSKPPLAFAFDIDGVLLRGEEVIPQARRALRVLEGDNALGMKIPYVLMTNGGGVSEEVRCERLTSQLGVEITLSQFMQAHTILKTIAHKYADRPVLVLGGKGDDIRRVAERNGMNIVRFDSGYGFRKVHTTFDILAWNGSAWPFHELTPFEREHTRPFHPETPISAIFVFHDPRNWALDVQITCDILRSRGYIGNPHRHYDIRDRAPVELIFCNPDLLWGSDFPVSRIGQGGFRIALQAVYKTLTGSEHPYVQFGKPTEPTYAFAAHLLRERIVELAAVSGHASVDVELPRGNIYMIGDNPESDIAGANAAGWSSVLVETGVFRRDEGQPTHKPTFIAKHVEEAVHWALQRELGY